MSGLSVLGGVGRGLMQGSQFVAQQRERRAQQEFNSARLGMLQEQHGWQREQQQQLGDERQRKAGIDKMMQEAVLSYQEQHGKKDLNAFDLGQIKSRVASQAASSGQMSMEDLEQMVNTQQQLEQSGLAELYRGARVSGDWAGMGAALSQKYGFAGAMNAEQVRDASGGIDTRFTFQRPDGQATQLNQSDLESLIGVDWSALAKAQQLAARKTASEINKNDRQGLAALTSAQGTAAANRELAALRRTEREGLEALPAEQRATRTRAGGSQPAEIQTLEWLIRHQVVDSPEKAWEMVRTARTRSPEEAITRIFNTLKQDWDNAGRPHDDLVREAQQIFQKIQAADTDPAAPNEDPLGLFSD